VGKWFVYRQYTKCGLWAFVMVTAGKKNEVIGGVKGGRYLALFA
jgi:hypothetical protein